MQPRLSRTDFPYAAIGLGTDLTAKAASGLWKSNPLIGRWAELQALMRNLDSGVVTAIVGAPGVGKSALVEGVAYAIANMDRELVPERLQSCSVVEFTPSDLLSRIHNQAEIEDRLDLVIRRLRTAAVIPVFDEAFVLFSDDIGLRSIRARFVPAIATGVIAPAILCMTDREFATAMKADAVLNSRLKRLELREPDQTECLEILRQRLLDYSRPIPPFSESALNRIIDLSRPGGLPRSALSLLESVATTKVYEIDMNPGRPATSVNEDEVERIFRSGYSFPVDRKQVSTSQDPGIRGEVPNAVFTQGEYSTGVTVQVANGELLNIVADVVAVKYAQSFYGADRAVANTLASVGVDEDSLRMPKGAHIIVPTRGAIRAGSVLFIGTEPLSDFTYASIQSLAHDVLNAIRVDAPSTTHLAMTVHGPGFGLDEVECIEQQLRGYKDAIEDGSAGAILKQITIVERDPDRAESIGIAVAEHLSNDSGTLRLSKSGLTGSVERATDAVISRVVSDTRVMSDSSSIAFMSQKPLANRTIREARPSAALKAKAFIAMPFSREFRDVWRYGIQKPLHDVGVLCERLDEQAFTGDVLAQIKRRIESASFIVADLTGYNPNVFLEVGYAWGLGRPTILLFRKRLDADETSVLPFDVRTQKCIIYDDVTDLEEKLIRELRTLF